MTDGNVFKKGDDAYYRLARNYFASNRMLDGLEMLRRAIELAPSHIEYRGILIRHLLEMGCVDQAGRESVKLSRFAPNDLNSELTVSQLQTMCMPSVPPKVWTNSDSERDLWLDDLRDMTDGFPSSRRSHYRGRHAFTAACEAYRNGEYAHCVRLLDNAYEKVGGIGVIVGLRYCALAKLEGEGFAEQIRSLANECKDFALRCLLAIALSICGETDEAKSLIEQIDLPEDRERFLLHCACAVGADGRVLTLAKAQLKSYTYERRLLHMVGVALLRTGVPTEEAKRYWTNIHRLDPEDEIAEYYTEHIDAFCGVELPYEYRLPDSALDERRRRLSEAFGKDDLLQWCDPELLRDLQWLAVHPEEPLYELVASVKGVKIQTPTVLRQTFSLGNMNVTVLGDREAMQNNALARFMSLPVGEKQFMKALLKDLMPNGISPEPIVSEWTDYRDHRKLNTVVMNDTESIMAAIACRVLERAGKDITVEELADFYKGKRRRAAFYKGCLSRSEQRRKERNHEDL